MTHDREDPVETLLRKQFDGPVPDDGYSARFMQKLPRRRRIAWPLWAGIVGGACACGLSLAATPLLQIGARDLMDGRLSVSALALLLAMAGLSLLTCGWSISEADDR